MQDKKSRTYLAVEKFFVIVKASAYFWLLLLKNILVYGIIDSWYQLYAIMQSKNSTFDSFKQIMSTKKRAIPLSKVISFVWSLILISLLSAGRMVLVSEGRIVAWQMLFIVSLVTFVVLTVFISHVVELSFRTRKENMKALDLYAVAFNQMLRLPTITFAMGTMVILGILVGSINLILFLFVFPGLLTFMQVKMFQMKREKEATL
jgi:hypothetical protein